MVLIVDDSKTMRMIVTRTLRQAGFGDHEFVEASNGMEALKIIQDDAPDVVLSDWNMPEMNGFELLQKLREAGNDVGFGFVTTETTDQIRQQALVAGASFFITKPFTADSFEAELGSILACTSLN